MKLNPANCIFSTLQAPQIKLHFITIYLAHKKELCMNKDEGLLRLVTVVSALFFLFLDLLLRNERKIGGHLV